MAMGEVVPFRSEARRRVLASKPEGPAQILFFLGVRYCRQEYVVKEEATDAVPGRRRRAGNTAPRSRRKKRA